MLLRAACSTARCSRDWSERSPRGDGGSRGRLRPAVSRVACGWHARPAVEHRLRPDRYWQRRHVARRRLQDGRAAGEIEPRSSRDPAELRPRSGPALVRRDRRRSNSLPPISVHLGSTLGQSISVHLGRLHLGCSSAASRLHLGRRTARSRQSPRWTWTTSAARWRTWRAVAEMEPGRS